jgi:signal transduction histidine kinase
MFIWREAMANRANQEGPRSAKSGRFEALLDKLVAVQMDLDPICGVGKEGVQIAASLEAIADACDVLRSAIADVRNIIHEANGLTGRPEAVHG